MQQQPTQPIPGPLTMPEAFRRESGAHTIMVSILLADLAGFLAVLLIGGYLEPPIWWLLRFLCNLAHASLLLDLAFLGGLTCVLYGRFRSRVLLKTPDDAWALPGTLMFLISVMLLLIIFLKTDWITIPAQPISTVPLEAFPWPLPFVPAGATIGAGLYLLAHLFVVERVRQQPPSARLAYARAHPGGSPWRLCEQAYAFYRQSLARFDPPPIKQLKTPRSFSYFEKLLANQDETNVLFNPEREMYWNGGHLILNHASIGPKAEQTDILLPCLARLIYDCNSPDRLVNQLFQLAHEAESLWPCTWLLCIPLHVQHTCEQQWNNLEREHVLDRDHFAYLVGEGKRLRKLLRQLKQQRIENNLPDNAVPTLTERIDHLTSLIRQEERQLKRLRAALPPAPPPSSPERGESLGC